MNKQAIIDRLSARYKQVLECITDNRKHHKSIGYDDVSQAEVDGEYTSLQYERIFLHLLLNDVIAADLEEDIADLHVNPKIYID